MKYTRDEINHKAVEILQIQNLLKDGDLVLLTKGDSMGVGGGSNAMKIIVVGKVM